MRVQGDVRVVTGVPTAGMFANASGSPIIINDATDTPYYLKAGVVTPLAGGGGGGGVTAVTGSSGVASSGGTTPNITLATIADQRILANISGGVAVPSANTMSAILDAILGSTQGQIITRNAGTWTVLGPGASGTFLKSNGAGANLSYATPSASLINWTEANTSAAPNGTVPVVSFTALNAAANVDAVIAVKGTGAFLAQVPDATTTGGNKRGANALDLQVSRTVATQVASSSNTALVGCINSVANSVGSSVFGGTTHTASGGNSVCVGGSTNQATASGAACLGGGSNVANNNNAVAMGGSSTASGSGSLVQGTGNTASGNNSFAIGNTCVSSGTASHATGQNSITRGLIAARAHASGRGSFADGDAQEMRIMLVQKTTDATPTVMTSNKSAASIDNQYVLADSMLATIRGLVSARTAAGVNSSWEFVASIKRGAGAGTTTMVAACTPTLIAQDAGAATWALAISADTVNGALKVLFTGAAVTIVSVATLWGAEATF